MIDGQKVFDQPVRNNLITYGSIVKIAKVQRDDYTTGCLLAYNYFKDYYKITAIDLSKQQRLDADPKAKQQIDFTRNLDQEAGATMLLRKQKKPFQIFHKKL